jgi:hypothetical protein
MSDRIMMCSLALHLSLQIQENTVINGKQVKISFQAFLYLRIVESLFNADAIQGVVDALRKGRKIVLGVRVLNMGE